MAVTHRTNFPDLLLSLSVFLIFICFPTQATTRGSWAWVLGPI
jgi:hypothetical protein